MEVDFVWWRGQDVVAIEVKHAREFRRELRLPVETFLRLLHAGEVIGRYSE